jgi:hypothetical protein
MSAWCLVNKKLPDWTDCGKLSCGARTVRP